MKPCKQIYNQLSLLKRQIQDKSRLKPLLKFSDELIEHLYEQCYDLNYYQFGVQLEEQIIRQIHVQARDHKGEVK